MDPTLDRSHPATAPLFRRTADPDGVWRELFRRHLPRYRRWMAPALVDALEHLPFEPDRAPRHESLSKQLHDLCGWRIETVPGLIPVSDFFALLRERRFPSPEWLRHEHELDYTPAPDLFHDCLGHLPQLLDPSVRSAIDVIADAGRTTNARRLVELERRYWFTIEFGLVATPAGIRAYGAGLGSSSGELARAVTGADVERPPLDLAEAAATDFTTTAQQDRYYVAPDLAGLGERLSAAWCH